jgi:hypothetical protein
MLIHVAGRNPNALSIHSHLPRGDQSYTIQEARSDPANHTAVNAVTVANDIRQRLPSGRRKRTSSRATTIAAAAA